MNEPRLHWLEREAPTWSPRRRTVSATRGAGTALLAFVAMWVTAHSQSQAVDGLTGAPALAHVYDAIFDARFDEVPASLAAACPPAPAEACLVLEAVSVWWEIQLDPFSTAHDTRFQSRVETAITATTAWTQREPERAEAWFFLGGAYSARARWRVLRGARLAAARDGKQIKHALERALDLDPGLADARFGIGLYTYYADVAPKALRMFRWLLLLPGGDREKGLAEMLRARATSRLLGDEADYQLHRIYLWYEKTPALALDLIEGLRARHPRNPHFWQAAAEIEDVYLHDITASLQTWEALLEAAQMGRVAAASMAEAAARLGMALQLDRLARRDAALEQLRAVIAAHPSAPFGASARAHYQLGQVLEHTGRNAEAAAAYRTAIAQAGRDDPLGIADGARRSLRMLGRKGE